MIIFERLRSYVSAICMIALFATVVIVNDKWHYGTIYYRYGWFYLTSFLFFTGTVVDILCRKKTEIRYEVSVLDCVIGLFVIYVSSNYYFTSSISETYISILFLLFICYLCLRHWFTIKPDFIILAKYVIVAIGSLEAIWGTLQLYKFLPSYHEDFLVTGSFLNPGPFGGFLAICIPIALDVILNERNSWRKLIMVGLFLLIITMLPASMSRSAWIASVLGILYVLYSYFRPHIRYDKVSKKKTVCLIIFLLIGLICICYSLFILKENSVFGRFQVWIISIRVFLDNFFLGVGLGNFSSFYGNRQIACFSNPETAILLNKNLADCPEYAFNEFIHAAVELGVVGLLFILAICYLAIKKGAKNDSSTGATGALLALLLFSCFSYPFRNLSFLLILMFIFAAVLAETNRKKEESIILFRYKLLYLVSFCVAIPFFLSRYQHFKALEKWNKAVYTTEYKEGYAFLRDQKLYMINYIDALIAEKRYFEAVSAIHQLQSYYCDLRPLVLESASYQHMGDFRQAEKSLIDAHNLVPSRLIPCYLLAVLYHNNGMSEKAKEWAKYVVKKDVEVMSDVVIQIKNDMNDMLTKYKDNETRFN